MARNERTLMNFAFRLPLAALLLTFCLPMFSLSAKAQNAARLPDLIVTDVLVSPAHPFAGDTVRFRVVIKNQGTAPTPEGVVIGGIFKLNGSTIAYTDQYKNALAPGESATLTANGGGGNGAGVWIAKAGSYTLGFQVDDVNRITESDKKNNELILPQPLKIVAFDGPDIVTRRLVWKRSKTAGKITLQAEITNIGNRPTAADVPIETRFLIDGAAVGAGKTAARSLPPGQSVIVAFGPVALPAGRHTIEALADPKGKIKERRTDNNRLLREAWVDQPMQYRAKPADDFADSVGVCIHLGYYDTAYGHYDTIKARLIESGVRYVREGVNLAGSDVIHKLNDLAASGIRSNLVLDPRQVSPEQAVLLVKALKNSVVSVEGPNEPNLFYSDWFPDSIRDYQKKLYAALKADPETAALPVLSPALAFPVEIAGRLGAVACDFGAMHPYPRRAAARRGIGRGFRRNADRRPKQTGDDYGNRLQYRNSRHVGTARRFGNGGGEIHSPPAAGSVQSGSEALIPLRIFRRASRTSDAGGRAAFRADSRRRYAQARLRRRRKHNPPAARPRGGVPFRPAALPDQRRCHRVALYPAAKVRRAFLSDFVDKRALLRSGRAG